MLHRLLAVPAARIPFPYSGTRLFDIPVYRVSPERWQQERDEEVSNRVSGWPHNELLKRRSEMYDRLVHGHGDYPYNQIIGWVHVAWVGGAGHVKCYYYRVAARSIGRYFRQGSYVESGAIAELKLWRHTSSEMLVEIRKRLIDETRGRGRLKGRYLDLEIFDNLAPVLDLRKLMRLDEP